METFESFNHIINRIRGKAETKRVAQTARESDFSQDFGQCDRHGPWQKNILDEFGRERVVPFCLQCRAESRVESLVERAAIPRRFAEKSLENFFSSSERQRLAVEAAIEYAGHLVDNPGSGRSMIFSGNPGTGKTHLACGIARRLIEAGRTAIYIRVGEMIRSIRDAWRRDGAIRSESEAVNRLADVDLLILDEVGVQYGTDSERIIMFDVLNARYERVRPSIILSNLTLQADGGAKPLKDCLGDRIMDRLREDGGRAILFDWDSHRGKSG